MAQHHLWILLLCLQTWPEAAGKDSEIFTVNGILGESVTFPVNIQEPQLVKIIAWTSKTSVAYVTPGDSEMAPIVTVTHRNYYERIHALGPKYNLVISDLRMEDAGDYKADINIEADPYTTTKRYNLQVYRRLGKPKITQSLMASVNSTCNVTLTCSVEKEEKNVTYNWSPLGEEGNVLQIFQTPEDQELTYTCTAQNPVSNNSDSISARQLCADIAMGFRTRHTGLLSVLAVFFLLVLILSSVFLFHLFKRRQGRIFPESSYLNTFTKNPYAASKKTIYTYIMASRNTQPAESRIYDEILQSKVLPSKEEPVNTVYSEVQFADKMGKASTWDSKPPGTSSYEIVI
ncbi:PREDICTED: SLAM family member 5 isoform X1 [Colobus angolensis palliatus]|uniref:Ig-like domain-containing protein n=1 Tax=Colobus angolensis palliatus TaxID=336983 RepID=A0A2K5IDZ1_COLAP|nr:PREDICTED: SLAM family member 5 isoform X1 [Colobus angolensis palliatus]